MRKDQLFRALEVSLQSLQAGVELDVVLDYYPEWGGELRPLLKSAYLAHQLGQAVNLPQATFDTERKLFLQSAQSIVPPGNHRKSRYRWTNHLRFALLFVLALVLMVGGSILARDLLPDSPFYVIKEFGRQLTLFIPADSNKPILSSLLFDHQRIEDIKSLADQSKTANVSFGGFLEQKDTGEWLVGELKLVQSQDTQLVGNIWSGYYVQVDGRLQANGEILVERIQCKQFKVDGLVEAVTPEFITMEGLRILLSSDTFLLGSLMPGVRAEVTLMVAEGELYQARSIKIVEAGIVDELFVDLNLYRKP